ncbi:hypothetical protein KIN20_014093 [Parelaphostrongylus tenuis]|uniref:Uncharacterized protein n=1 Tax=Parelaphostrongylus tenuis TaxID=148309 RepID=A0AAD5MD35_PARTN|nr:hypothetical protein KIN20_014093 [Parelaphostrongylus tenuis]
MGKKVMYQDVFVTRLAIPFCVVATFIELNLNVQEEEFNVELEAVLQHFVSSSEEMKHSLGNFYAAHFVSIDGRSYNVDISDV